MTDKTSADYARTYRNKQRGKVERMTEVCHQATAALLEHDAGGVTLNGWRDLRAAIAALADTK